MSVPIIAAAEGIHAERWREWQLENARGQKKEAARARLAFTTLFIVVTLWLGLQLMS